MDGESERARHLERRITVQCLALCALAIALGAACALRLTPEECRARVCQGRPVEAISAFTCTCGDGVRVGLWEVSHDGR